MNWDATDFIVMGAMLTVTCGTYALAARMTAYRAAVGVIGALIARFQPRGMARASCATAIAQALVAVVALIAGEHHSPGSSVAEILGVNGIFVVSFLGSAGLFRRAARAAAA